MKETIPATLPARDRQLAAISILCDLASAESIDLGLRSASGSFQPFLSVGLCDSSLDEALAACRSRNARDCDVYYRPARVHPASVVFLDDLDHDTAERLSAGRAHLLIETSPSNFQLWLKTDRTLSEDERKTIQKRLVASFGGDPMSISGEHFGRLSGFKNRKPKYNLPWVNLVSFSTGDAPLEVSPLLITESVDMVGSRPPRGACVLVPAAGESRRAASDSTESHKEFKYACESLRKNVARDVIIHNIATRALARGKRRTADAAAKYAVRTVDVAASRINC